MFAPGALILFQGDSITHGGRGPTEDPNHVLGHSYPFLVGANDVGAIVDGHSDDTEALRFRASYDELLGRTVDALPQIRLVLGEPFSLPVGQAVRSTWAAHAEVVRKLAADYEATFVPY